MTRDSRIFVAGGNTLIGTALLELLSERGLETLVGVDDEPDLTSATEVEQFFAAVRPDYVYLVGGKSGGIGLNRERPADLMLDNLRTITNVIDAAHRFTATKLLYLASSCVYPKLAPQPLRIDSLSTGPMEPTSEAYSTAKFAGWKLCDAYRRQYGSRFVTCFPANAFGPYDDFGANSGHVIPGLIRRTHEAKENGDGVVTIWGTGTPQREFIYSRDLADACLFAMQQYDGNSPINLGSGIDLSIADAARSIADVIGFRGHLAFDTTKPDGAARKGLDSRTLFDMGWKPRTEFRTAVVETYNWFLENVDACAVV